MSEKQSEKSKMSSVEFAQYALRERVAPPSLGSIKARLRHATRAMLRKNEENRKLDREEHWTPNRVRDCWYADPRISPNADEIRDLEELTGLRYGREELKEIDSLIDRASALMGSEDPHFHSAFVAALRAFASALDSSRAGRDR